MAKKCKKETTTDKQKIFPMEISEEFVSYYKNQGYEVRRNYGMGGVKATVCLIPVDEKTYNSLMPEIWKESKRKLRSQEKLDNGVYTEDNALSLDQFYEENSYEVPSMQYEPLAIKRKEEFLDVLYQIIDDLTAQERLIVEAYMDKKPQREIAEQLNVSQKAISKRQKNIFKKMRQELSNYELEDILEIFSK